MIADGCVQIVLDHLSQLSDDPSDVLPVRLVARFQILKIRDVLVLVLLHDVVGDVVFHGEARFVDILPDKREDHAVLRVLGLPIEFRQLVTTGTAFQVTRGYGGHDEVGRFDVLIECTLPIGSPFDGIDIGEETDGASELKCVFGYDALGKLNDRPFKCSLSRGNSSGIYWRQLQPPRYGSDTCRDLLVRFSSVMLLPATAR